ncbi:MAG: citrate/2-methylcitrate synthase [Streptococcaceae bacterium]|jgi:citrate synthase|nr:citrate/2-methylcitrate synthase [Streptococcaceae bacterium]
MAEALYNYYGKIVQNSQISSDWYQKYDVKKGLRDVDGKGVLAGLTNISAIHSFDEEGKEIPGILEFRGYNIKDIVGNLKVTNRFGFEEMAYLLLMGDLPTHQELEDFKSLLAKKRKLPKHFVRETILATSSADIMNSMSRCLLMLASYDENVNDLSLENVLDQSFELIANFPLLAIYAYQSYYHYELGNSLFIHNPDPALTTAENILRMLRPDSSYTDMEAKVLDIALILHMEHGGGNNSTFTTHVVTSSGTDTYAAIAAALSSLKGPKHGGANIRSRQMMKNIEENVSDWQDDAEISAYLEKILNKEAFDQKGLIYGIGHAIYSISDPRFEVFEGYVEALAKEKGMEDEFALYEKVAKLAPEVISKNRTTFKSICPNIDFFSGFVYEILGIPQELFTPLFAIARIVGWSAHRMEELINMNKIIRPAYESVLPSRNYVKIEERK